MSEVKRYLKIREAMEPSPHGKYVRYEDYLAVTTELEKMRAKLGGSERFNISWVNPSGTLRSDIAGPKTVARLLKHAIASAEGQEVKVTRWPNQATSGNTTKHYEARHPVRMNTQNIVTGDSVVRPLYYRCVDSGDLFRKTGDRIEYWSGDHSNWRFTAHTMATLMRDYTLEAVVILEPPEAPRMGAMPDVNYTPSRDTNDAIERLLSLAGIACEPGWSWDEVAWKIDTARERMEELYGRTPREGDSATVELRRELEELKRQLWGAERRVVNLETERDTLKREVEELREDKVRLDTLEGMDNPRSNNPMTDRQQEPEIDASEYTIGSLMTAILTGELALPAWIRFGKTRHQITFENKDGIAKGLLMALEFQEYYSRP